MDTQQTAPLAGIVVVAIEQAVAAPFCTARLADAGAQVIKIERPEGDFARFYDTAGGADSSYFVWLNRGKRSVVLDLATSEGRDQLCRLIRGADVLVQNLKAGAMGRMGLGMETLRAGHPSLICCSISGYGEDGPLAGRKAYDLLVQAESGLASITGGPDAPARVGISIVDIATGATAHAAVLEALIARGRTGRGSDIRISMFDVMADWLTVPLLQTEAGLPPQRLGLAHPSIAPYGVFATGDGRNILISIQSDREWVAFCHEVLRAPELAAAERFATNVARVSNRAETDRLIADTFRAHSRAEIIAALDRADTAYADLNDMAGLGAHPHLQRVIVATSSGELAIPAPAPIFDGQRRNVGAVPPLGVNTTELLLGAPSEETVDKSND